MLKPNPIHDDPVIQDIGERAGLFSDITTPLDPPFTQESPNGNLTVNWGDDRGQIRVEVSGLSRRRDGLHAFLAFSIRPLGEGQPWRPLKARERINLYSNTAKDGLRRSLEIRSKRQWPERIEQLVIAIEEYHMMQSAATRLADMPEPGDTHWLLKPMLEVDEHTMLFADGGTGKSLLSLAIAVSVASGEPIVPSLSPPMPTPVLYLDWETSPEIHRRRLGQICRARNISMPRNIWYVRMDTPLGEAAADIREMVREHGIGLAIIDSVGMAGDGDLTDLAVGNGYGRLVRSIGCTALSITHVPKDRENRAAPIGSVGFRNSARQTWKLVAHQIPGQSVSHISLFHNKNNNGPLARDIGLRVDFSEGMVRYYPEDTQSIPEIASQTSAYDQIVGVLKQGRAEVSVIAEETGLKDDAIRKVFSRDQKSPRPRFVRFGEGRTAEWGMAFRGNADNVVPFDTFSRQMGGHREQETPPWNKR